MNILIVGTGVIGTLYGCALSQKHNVTHYVRDKKQAILNNKEITYDLIDERLPKKNQNTTGSYKYSCVSKVEDNYDLIIVPVKTFQIIDVLKTLTSQVKGAKYLLMTLDWNMSSDYDNILGKANYILGYAGGGGTFRGNELWANIGNDMMLGAVYPKQQSLLETTTQMFRSCGIIPNIPKNPLHWLWIHNVSSAPLGAALLKYRDINKLLCDKALLKTSFKAMRECFKICEKRGVDIKNSDEVKMMSFPLFLLIPIFKLNFTKNPVMKRYTAHAVSSIDEMVDNFKEIYETGKTLGVEMPNMDELMKIVNDAK